MDLREYYNLPEWSNVSLKYLVVTDTISNDIPLLTDCKYLYAYKNISVVPHILTENVTDMSYMFYNCTSLEYVNLSNFNTSNVANMSYMFYGCNKIIEINLQGLDTSNVTNISKMFSTCKKLKEINLQGWDTSKITDMSEMFDSCSELEYVDLSDFNTSNVTNMKEMFDSCAKLKKIDALDCGGITTKNYYPLYTYSSSNYTNLTDVGGFLNMKMSWDNNYGLAMCSNLTRESCTNILNGLYDFVANNETPTSNQGKLKVHANFLTEVGDDISIAVNKGWTVTS